MDEKQFNKVTAYFKPLRTDDLREEAKQYIGQKLEFQYAWMMDEGDRFSGVWALLPTDHDVHMGWVPEFDLQEIE